MLTVNNPKNFDWKNISLYDCCKGNAMDAYFTLKIFDLVEEKIEEINSQDIINKVLSPANIIFSEMEYSGLDVSPSILDKVGRKLKDKNIKQNDDLYRFPQVNNTDNLASSKDLIEILYTREIGFRLYPPDRTEKEAPSVSAPTLKILLEHITEELSKRDG